MTAHLAARAPPPFVNVYSAPKPAGVPEQAFVTLWMLVCYLPLEIFAPLRYLCILGFMALTVIDYQRILPLLLRAWPLFLVGLFGLLSTFWSANAGAGLRQGVLMVISAFVVVVIAGRLTTRQILRTIMFAGMAATLASIPYWDSFRTGGLYGSKNWFAVHMLFCMLLSLIVSMNEQEPWPLRLVALVFVPVCFVFLFMAQSATALVIAVLGGAGLIGVKLVWAPAAGVRGLPTLIILGAISLAGAVLFIIASMPQASLVESFLALVGKDPTLTGRTAIWEGARLAAQERPWLGHGLEGFWYYDSGAAQTLNEGDYKPYGTRHNFHNAYWEVRVHLGYLGLGLFLFMLAWTSLRFCLLWLRDGSLLHSALLLLIGVNIIMTFTESGLFGVFTAPVFLQALAGLLPLGLHEPRFEGRAWLTDRP